MTKSKRDRPGGNQSCLEAHSNSGSVVLGRSHPVTGTKVGIASYLDETTHGDCSKPVHSLNGGYSGPLLLDFSVGAVRPVSESAGGSQNVDSIRFQSMVPSHMPMGHEYADVGRGRKRVLQCDDTGMPQGKKRAGTLSESCHVNDGAGLVISEASGGVNPLGVHSSETNNLTDAGSPLVDVPSNFECAEESLRNTIGSSVSAQEFLLESSLAGESRIESVVLGQGIPVSGNTGRSLHSDQPNIERDSAPPPVMRTPRSHLKSRLGNRMGNANTYGNRLVVHNSVTMLESRSAYTQATSVCSGRSEEVLRSEFILEHHKTLRPLKILICVRKKGMQGVFVNGSGICTDPFLEQ